MATGPDYSEEQLNYYRICYVTTDLISESLRTIFKQEWDNRFKTTLGEWKDEPRNGLDFYNGESPGNQRRNARLLGTMINGNTSQWDCTMLFYAILYSDSIGHGLNAALKSNVDDLRKFRNEDFAHLPQGCLSDAEFQIAIAKVQLALQALGLSTTRIQEIRSQTSFPTKELRKVLKEVDDLKQELHEKEEQRQILEDQLQTEVSPFCVLPPKPSHDVAGRNNEVARITQQLKELKDANEGCLSYLYISGNPGSGKSQLAGLVAKKIFEVTTDNSRTLTFVMTLNAESAESLLESYVSFARHLKCPEYAITNTFNSNDLNTEKKIANLKSLVGAKVELYTSWLLLVDNVTSTFRAQPHLPEPGNEQWFRGQILITTQDAISIPPTNLYINHISVSKGMELADATSLLATLSGVTDIEMEKAVVRALDFQPLALAGAATFLKQVRESNASSNFGWREYLEKLEKGHRPQTETFLSETNSSYPKSMTAAITLAVENVMSSDKVLNHTFRFISLCAREPLNLELVINYILKVEKENVPRVDDELKDKDIIRRRIRKSSLLLLKEEDNDVLVSLHQVVHDVIETKARNSSEGQHLAVLHGAIESFNQFAEDNQLTSLNSLVKSWHVAPHLRSLIENIENAYSKGDIPQLVKNIGFNIAYYPDYFVGFSHICNGVCDFNTGKRFCELAFKLILHGGKLFSDANTTEVNVLIVLGVFHGNLSEFQLAKQYFERALAIQLRKHGRQHVDVAASYDYLAWVLGFQGDLKQAKEYHERALGIRLQKLEPHHLDVAASYNNLADTLFHLGDLEQAKEYNERALAIQLEKLEPHHINIATTLDNFGIVLRGQGDLQQAKEYHFRSLAILLETFGPQHVAVATSYCNLANVFYAQGDLENAKEYNERSLAIQLQKLGPQHADFGSSYRLSGRILHHQGYLDQAKEYYERSLSIVLPKLGPQGPEVATCYTDLASVSRDQGDLVQAKEYYDRALAIRLQIFGPQNAFAADSYCLLGGVLRDQGELMKAKECYDRALTIYLDRFGPKHPRVASVQRSLLQLHQMKQS